MSMWDLPSLPSKIISSAFPQCRPGFSESPYCPPKVTVQDEHDLRHLALAVGGKWKRNKVQNAQSEASLWEILSVAIHGKGRVRLSPMSEFSSARRVSSPVRNRPSNAAGTSRSTPRSLSSLLELTE